MSFILSDMVGELEADLSCAEKAVLRVLADRADGPEGYCYLLIETLAAKARVSRRTVSNVINRLSDLKLIIIDPRRGKADGEQQCSTYYVQANTVAEMLAEERKAQGKKPLSAAEGRWLTAKRFKEPSGKPRPDTKPVRGGRNKTKNVDLHRVHHMHAAECTTCTPGISTTVPKGTSSTTSAATSSPAAALADARLPLDSVAGSSSLVGEDEDFEHSGRPVGTTCGVEGTAPSPGFLGDWSPEPGEFEGAEHPSFAAERRVAEGHELKDGLDGGEQGAGPVLKPGTRRARDPWAAIRGHFEEPDLDQPQDDWTQPTVVEVEPEPVGPAAATTAPVYVPSVSTGNVAAGFNAFWVVYPRPVDQKRAREAWRAARRRGVDAEDLIRAAEVYADSVADVEDSRLIKRPAAWLDRFELVETAVAA